MSILAPRNLQSPSNVTQQGNDYQQLEPMVKEMKSNLGGEKPKKFSADNGYLSESNLEYLEHENIDSYIATGKEKGVKEEGKKKGRIPKSANLKERMRRKLKTKKGSNVYKRRKSIVEPVFGQVKEERGFRRFSFRGFENVGFEWDIVCLSHNLLKLFRSGKAKLAIG